MAGLFITFEGVEGCGKTTQIELLRDWLAKRDCDAVSTREPGGTSIGGRLRAILLDPKALEMSSITEALLYAASRAQLVKEIIRPALAAGKVVVCDRYIDSSLAYQVWGRGLDFQTIMTINEWAADRLLPDLTILLRMSAEKGLDRVIEREPDRLEREDIKFHQLVETGYEDLAVKYSERFAIINGSDTIEAVHSRIVACVEPVLGVWRKR